MPYPNLKGCSPIRMVPLMLNVSWGSNGSQAVRQILRKLSLGRMLAHESPQQATVGQLSAKGLLAQEV